MPGTKYLEGCIIAVPDREAWEVIERNLLAQIQEAGGIARCTDDGPDEGCTHLLVERAAEGNAAPGQQTVTLLWLNDCVESRTLLAAENEKLYSGDYSKVALEGPGSQIQHGKNQLETPTPEIGVIADFVVTTTAYQGLKKVAYGRMIQALGLTCTKTMNPKATDVVIAGDVTEQSPKIEAAMAHGIPVVSVLWLYDSIRQSILQPTEKYCGNPARSMDPFHGALAKDCSLEVVANSGSSDEEEPPAQTEVIDWTGRHSDRLDGSRKTPLEITPASHVVATASNSSAQKAPSTLDVSTVQMDGGSEKQARHRLSNAGTASRSTAIQALQEPKARPASVEPDGEASPQDRNTTASTPIPGATLRKPSNLGPRGRGSKSGVQTKLKSVKKLSRSGQKRGPIMDLTPDPDETPDQDASRKEAADGAGVNAARLGVPEAVNANARGPAANELMDGSCADMSEMVAAANADVDMLVNHLVPDASQPIENYAQDPISEEHNQNPEEQEADSLGAMEAAPHQQGASYKIPVVSDAPLASQQHEEPVDEELGEEPRPPPKRQRQNASGVSWMAEPVRKRRKKAAATSAVEPSPEHLPEADEGAGEANPTTAKISKGKGSRKVAKPKPKANGKRTKGAAVKHDSPADEEVQQADGQIPDQENSQDKIQGQKPKRRGRPPGRRASGVTHKTGEKQNNRRKSAPPDIGDPKASKERPTKRSMFSVSGMHTKQRDTVVEQLRGLGQAVSLDLHSHSWDNRITHLILPRNWVRGAKVLAGMAAGVWFLRDSYLKDSTKAHRFLEEDDYEMADNPKNTTSKDACRHWRLARALKKKGAFEGLKVAVYGDFEAGFRPTKAEISSILQAGGAKLLSVNQANSAGVHFVMTKPSRPPSEPKVKQLLGAGQCVVYPMFVVDWLAHPQKMLDEHLIDGSTMGAELKAAVADRSVADGAVPEQTSLRMNAGRPSHNAKQQPSSPDSDPTGDSDSEESKDL